MVTRATAGNRYRTSPPATADISDLRGTVGYMMGKLEGIEARLDLTERQQTRMEGKIDCIPDVVREAVSPLIAPLAEGFKSHADRLDALEKADAIEQGGIKTISSLRTRIFAGIGALGTSVGIVTGAWELFHK